MGKKMQAIQWRPFPASQSLTKLPAYVVNNEKSYFNTNKFGKLDER